jgi:CHAT domain-containing protein
MTRGFMYAGSSRVIAGLWDADDLVTTELVENFYKAMEQDKMAPAAALRYAQIQMWKQNRWSDPYYWAGFQIHGEWK